MLGVDVSSLQVEPKPKREYKIYSMYRVVQKNCIKFIVSELCNCESQHHVVFTKMFRNLLIT